MKQFIFVILLFCCLGIIMAGEFSGVKGIDFRKRYDADIKKLEEEHSKKVQKVKDRYVVTLKKLLVSAMKSQDLELANKIHAEIKRVQKGEAVKEKTEASIPASSEDSVSLTKLEPDFSVVGWDKLRINDQKGHEPLKVAGKDCKEFIFGCCVSDKDVKLVYTVPRGIKYFFTLWTDVKYYTGQCFIEDGNGRTLFKSKILSSYKDKLCPILIKIPDGVHKITIRLTGPSSWGIWAWPRFCKTPPKVNLK